MPINKNAFLRYKIIDSCLSNPVKRFCIDDLRSECLQVMQEIEPTSTISRRQIYLDIAFMESSEGWSVDIVKETIQKKVYYRYSDTKFSILHMPLNAVELSQLESAINTLSNFKGMPQFDWLQECIPRLQSVQVHKESQQCIEFETNEYLRGLNFLSDLYNAIVSKNVLHITYKPFQGEEQSFVLHPYYLKQYNTRWFLLGYHELSGKYDWNVPIDRIVSIVTIQKPYIENTEIDWQEYYDDIIGVTMPENATVEEIVLRFYNTTGHYIETKPMHNSQRGKWIDDITYEVKLKLKVNYECERLIHSYAHSVEVISPAWLRTSIQNKCRETIDL